MSSYWTLVVAILAISPNNEILSVDVEKHHSLYTNFANCVIVGESHVQPVQEMMDDIILNELRVTGNKVMIQIWLLSDCYGQWKSQRMAS